MLVFPEPSEVSFQKQLGEFVVEHKLTHLVETGLGVSTVYLLDALDTLGDGQLTSIDPEPWYKREIVHLRLKWIAKRSSEALWQVQGPWDLFLHDGCHNVFSQTLEYYYGWSMLRKGGWLVTDDYSWGSHCAWAKFLDRLDVKEQRFSSIAMIQKTTEPTIAPQFAWREALATAHDAERSFIATGGKNSECFKDY